MAVIQYPGKKNLQFSSPQKHPTFQGLFRAKQFLSFRNLLAEEFLASRFSMESISFA